MLACKAYYSAGLFIPFETLEIPEGSQAIITVIDFPSEYIEETTEDSQTTSRRQKEAIAFFQDLIQDSEPLPPEFDEILSHRMDIKRSLAL